MRFKKHFVLAVLLAALFAVALLGDISFSQLYVPMWDSVSGRYTWYQFGTGFTKSGNVITVTPQAATVPVLGVRLTYDPVGVKYPLPADANLASLAVYVNGLRYASPGDFTVVSRALIPPCAPGSVDCNWPTGAVVLVDYSK